MIKYRTRWDKIEAVEVVKETEKQVVAVLNGREQREAKKSTYQNYHDTWGEAKQFLVDEAQRKCEGLRKQLERANGELGKIKSMKE